MAPVSCGLVCATSRFGVCQACATSSAAWYAGAAGHAAVLRITLGLQPATPSSLTLAFHQCVT